MIPWGRSRNQRLVSSLGILPSKSVRLTGASFRPTEYPTFFVKIETQAHTFHNATPWARCRVWLQRSTPQQFAAQGRLANGRDSRHRLCLLSDKGADFRQSIAREPPQALAPAPDPVP